MTVLDSMFGEAMAVNDRGQIVGRGMVSGSYHAFLREDGEMIDLGTLGGRQSRPMDINNQTQIVGDLDDAEHAFLWEDGELTDLGTLTVDRACEYDTCSASAINIEGQIVGGCDYVLDQGRAFLWEDGELTDLGTLGGDLSEATAINDEGQIVGLSTAVPGHASQQAHAFLWTDGEMIDLGTLGGMFSAATAINERGQVVGFSETAGGALHAFLWADGEMTDLGALEPDSNSFAADINDEGEIVGESGQGWGGQAVLWKPGR